jgi:hypothetical protein
MTPGSDAAQQARVTVVYCGGCNPHIDRGAVAAALPADDDPAVRPGATVHLSGCPRACASAHRLAVAAEGGDLAAHEVPRDATKSVVVAGELVDGVPTPAAGLAAAVTRKLKE